MYEQIQRACASLRRHDFDNIETGLVLGTGLGALPPAFAAEHTLGFDTVDGFQPASAPGHSGTLSVGDWHGQRVLIMQGRFHLYEGLSAAEVVRPVYVVRALGARSLIVTNAAGALNPAFRPADLMLITDHLNFTGVNPLGGVDDERLGPRFPDLSRAYAPALRERALTTAAAAGIALHQGVYAAVHGPSLETSAERRFLRGAGGDAVGMSTALEVIAANHCGLEVLGFSAITNEATGDAGQQPDTIEAVLDNAARAGQTLLRLLDALLAERALQRG